MKESIEIYTDGACSRNPGPGGWGAVILGPDKAPVEINGGQENTTNNQMELTAVIKALDLFQTEKNKIVLYTDSTYVKNGITQWIHKWKQNNWKTSSDTSVKNADLWKQLDECTQKHEIQWKWVKGHADNQWNNRADELARTGVPLISETQKPEILPIDDPQAIHIFTAIAFSTRRKMGGWAVYFQYKDHTKHISGKVENTSSNRLHIISAIEALQLVKKKYPIHAYTFADYLKDGASIWVRNWHRNQWKTKDGEAVKHQDLWMKLLKLTQLYQIKWHRVSKKNMPEAMRVVKDKAQEMVPVLPKQQSAESAKQK